MAEIPRPAEIVEFVRLLFLSTLSCDNSCIQNHGEILRKNLNVVSIAGLYFHCGFPLNWLLIHSFVHSSAWIGGMKYDLNFRNSIGCKIASHVHPMLWAKYENKSEQHGTQRIDIGFSAYLRIHCITFENWRELRWTPPTEILMGNSGEKNQLLKMSKRNNSLRICMVQTHFS